MSTKEFQVRGHCLSTNPIIVNYLKNNFERFLNSKHPKKAIGVAWNKERWWYVTNHSSTPEYSPLTIMGIITKINEMKNLSIATSLSTSSGVISDSTNYDISTTTGTLLTSSGVISDNNTCTITSTNTTTTTAAPIYNPNYSFPNTIWINGSDACITTNLVTEPSKLRIKCQNLKKNLKVSLLQINLK